MITKNTLKEIHSLRLKKNRLAKQQFVVEGEKGVHAFLEAGFQAHYLLTTHAEKHPKADLIGVREMQRISQLKNPSTLLGVFSIPAGRTIANNGLVLMLDTVADPGNLGTLIRLCDWFGITDIVCSLTTVDCYNAKVVQATMGSLARVTCHYLDLVSFLNEDLRPVYGTFMEGKSIYATALPKDAILVLGNEANGISQELVPFITEKISIPKTKSEGPESLNVAIAGAIVLGVMSNS